MNIDVNLEGIVSHLPPTAALLLIDCLIKGQGDFLQPTAVL
jgi:hypothetical protein